MADRIKILGNGRILQSGRPHDIYFHPQHKFVAKMFGLMNRFESVVDAGCVRIPLGQIQARGFADGQRVEVLVRPEGVTLQSNAVDGVPVEVQSTHLLGHDNIVRVRFSNETGDQTTGEELYVRVHHAFEPELSKQITAGVDPDYAFIYAIGEGSDEGIGVTFRPPQSTPPSSISIHAEAGK